MVLGAAAVSCERGTPVVGDVVMGAGRPHQLRVLLDQRRLSLPHRGTSLIRNLALMSKVHPCSGRAVHLGLVSSLRAGVYSELVGNVLIDPPRPHQLRVLLDQRRLSPPYISTSMIRNLALMSKVPLQWGDGAHGVSKFDPMWV